MSPRQVVLGPVAHRHRGVGAGQRPGHGGGEAVVAPAGELDVAGVPVLAGIVLHLGGGGHVVSGETLPVRGEVDDVRGAVGTERQALAPSGEHAQVVVVGVVLHHQDDDVPDLRQQVGALGQVRARPGAGARGRDPAPRRDPCRARAAPPDLPALQPLPHVCVPPQGPGAARRSPRPLSFPRTGSANGPAGRPWPARSGSRPAALPARSPPGPQPSRPAALRARSGSGPAALRDPSPFPGHRGRRSAVTSLATLIPAAANPAFLCSCPGINVEHLAYAEDPVPPRGPFPPHKPFPPRYFLGATYQDTHRCHVFSLVPPQEAIGRQRGSLLCW